MPTATEIADDMRASYAKGMLEGMRGPVRYFADRFESCFVPPRASDGWFDAKRLYDFQDTEHAVFQKVMPDAHLTDVTVLTRAEDQIIVVMTLTGTLRDGTAFTAPVTMVYDVRDGQIVRVAGIYDVEKLKPFQEAFEESAATGDVPIQMTTQQA